MGTLSSVYNLREDITRFNDVADFVDSFDDWTSWTPVFTAIGGMNVAVNTIHAARYMKIGTNVFFDIDLSITTSGAASSWLEMTIPAGAGLTANSRPLPATYIQPGTDGDQKLASCFLQGLTLLLRRPEGGNFTLDTMRIRISGVRRV